MVGDDGKLQVVGGYNVPPKAGEYVKELFHGSGNGKLLKLARGSVGDGRFSREAISIFSCRRHLALRF